MAAILVFGVLFPVGGMLIHFAPRLKRACGAEHFGVLQESRTFRPGRFGPGVSASDVSASGCVGLYVG